jgi:hypothetical protein
MFASVQIKPGPRGIVHWREWNVASGTPLVVAVCDPVGAPQSSPLWAGRVLI